MKTVYFDLSELFYASSSRLAYYGIARTVFEVAFEVSLLDEGVKFVVYSPGHQMFFSVNPCFSTVNGEIRCDLGVPDRMRPIHLRKSFPTSHWLRDISLPVATGTLGVINRQRWRSGGSTGLAQVDLTGQTLVAYTRPKIMVDYISAMASKAVRFDFCPLLHDMIPLHALDSGGGPKFARNFKHDNSIVIQNAALLLANSECTKREIQQFSDHGHLPASLPEIATVPLSHQFRHSDEASVQQPPSGPNFLCVGTQTGRKNLECVVSAMRILEQAARPVPRLVLAGARRKRTETFIAQREFDGIREAIEYRINPNQAELEALYRNARGLVIPSRIEGWGLPLGEAMWLGTPGIASTAAALKEVGGGQAIYFDPDAPRELAGILDRLHTDDVAYREACRRTREARQDLRSWKDVAHDTLQAVRQFL